MSCNELVHGHTTAALQHLGAELLEALRPLAPLPLLLHALAQLAAADHTRACHPGLNTTSQGSRRNCRTEQLQHSAADAIAGS